MLRKALALMVLFPSLVFGGVYTDPAAQGTDQTDLTTAVGDLGNAEVDVYITGAETVNDLTIPAKWRVHFLDSAQITVNAGMRLTFATTAIIAPNHQIFAGAGNVDFADGTVVDVGWFSSGNEAIAETVNDTVTLLMSKQVSLTSNATLGNNVRMTWEAAGNSIVIYGGKTLSNVKDIQAGQYQLFSGAGTVAFSDGAHLNSAWFAHLRTALAMIDDSKVLLRIQRTETVDLDSTVNANTTLEFLPGGLLSPNAGKTLTVNGDVFIYADQEASDITTGSGTVTFNGSLNLRGDLASTASGKGADMVVTHGGGMVGDALPYAVKASVTNQADAEEVGSLAYAIAQAGENATIVLPAGTLPASGDIHVSRRTQIVGQGYGTHLAFTGGGLVLDDDGSGDIYPLGLRNVRVSRAGAAGPAVYIHGSDASGVARWNIENLVISASTGSGLKIEGSWIGTLSNPIIAGCTIGIEVTPATSTSGNALTITGGEIRTCSTAAISLSKAAGVVIKGTAIEGNTGKGIVADDTVRGLTVTAYFEANADYDIDLVNTAAGYSTNISNSLFFGPSGTTRSDAIRVTRGKAVIIDGCSFINYTSSPITINEQAGSPVTGEARHCYKDSASSIPMVANDSTTFGRKTTVRLTGNETAADATATELEELVLTLPDTVASTLTFTGHFKVGAATAGDVRLGYSVYNGPTLLYGPVYEAVANGGTSVINTSTLSRALSDADRATYADVPLRVWWRRDGSDASDTLTETITWLGGEVTYYQGHVQ